MRYFLVVIFSYLLFNPLLLAKQPAQTIKQVQLKDNPSINSQSIKTLETDTAVFILNRKGGWYNVETDPQLQGWLKMLWLRYPSNKTKKNGFSLISKNTKGVTVATGVRGLSENELEKGQGDPNAINEIEQFVITSEQSEIFAEAAGLISQPLPYIDN